MKAGKPHRELTSASGTRLSQILRGKDHAPAALTIEHTRTLLRRLPTVPERDELTTELDQLATMLELPDTSDTELRSRAWLARERASQLVEALVLRPIREAIRKEQACDARFIDTYVVADLGPSGGDVHAFRLIGHPESDRAFAWRAGTPPELTIALATSTITTAIAAVRSTLRARTS